MIMLLDYDSVIYKACYKVVNINDIKLMIKKGWSREKMEESIVDSAITRLSQVGDNLMNEIDNSDFIKEQGIDIQFVEYFITRSQQSIRRKMFPDYKKNREPKTIDKWVRKVRDYLIASNIAEVDKEWEADDLIADRARELGINNVLIVSLDKDMSIIPGLHFNFYRKPSKEFDEYGFKKKNPMTGFKIVSDSEALYNLYYMMLVGDSIDNIKGVQGIGPVNAKRILEGLEDEQDYKTVVMKEYIKKYGQNGLYYYKKNEFLLALGKKDVQSFFKIII